jgi:hypothetical protein
VARSVELRRAQTQRDTGACVSDREANLKSEFLFFGHREVGGWTILEQKMCLAFESF